MRILLLLFLMINGLSLCGQSYFYNTQQFGLTSTLLGGAVTAGSEDLSMAFYNPAALRYAKSKGLDLALVMPNFTRNIFGDFLKGGTYKRVDKLGFNSSLASYKTNIFGLDLVLSILQKDRWDSGLEFFNVTNDADFRKTVSINYSYRGDEKWFGIGSSYGIGEHFSFGISHFWSLLSSKYQYSLSSELFNKNTQLQDQYFSENLSIGYSSTFSMVTKIGFSFDHNQNRFGLVITSPNYSPLFRGASFERTTVELVDGGFNTRKIVDFSPEPDLKNALEVKLGYGKIFQDSTELWVSTSYHTGVPDYNIFKLRNEGHKVSLKGGLKSIVNVSVGFSKKLSDHFQFLASFRTNFLAYENKEQELGSQRFHILTRDKYQIATGFNFNKKNSSFVIGIDWGISRSDNADVFKHFPNIELFDMTPSKYKSNSFTFLVTYQFIIDSVGKNLSKLVE